MPPQATCHPIPGTLINCQSRISKAFTTLMIKTKKTKNCNSRIILNLANMQKYTLGTRLQFEYCERTSLMSEFEYHLIITRAVVFFSQITHFIAQIIGLVN